MKKLGNKIPLCIHTLWGVLIFLHIHNVTAQPYPGGGIDVLGENGFLENPWVGGLDLPQFSLADYTFDGKKDLIVFDKKGNKWLLFAANDDGYWTHTPQFERRFPEIINMGLAKDYNCDGIVDLFAHTNQGIRVYKGSIDNQIGLQFEVEKSILEFYTGSNDRNIYKYNHDIPAITDVDADGDIDILSFDLLGTTLSFYQNMSVENGYECDSLIFVENTACWGNFQESAATNDITLDVSCKGGSSSGGGNGSRHAGSTVLAFDADEDADKDILLGDVSYGNLVHLINDGDLFHAYISAFQTDFPSADVPVDMPIFPAAYELDVTQNGLSDIIVAPNSNAIHFNDHSVWLYENTGNPFNRYQLQQTDFLQESMIDVGSFSSAAFFDHNADGLLDLIVANENVSSPRENEEGSLTLYEHVGTSSSPAFEWITNDYMNISALNTEYLRPTFGDIDNDGDDDMLIGSINGFLYYFNNSAGAGNTANFNLVTTQYFNIDVGSYAHPQWVDLNEDGLLDLIVGKQQSYGEIEYYWNFGSVLSAQFHVDSVNSALGNIRVNEPGFVPGYSAPHIAEIDGETYLYTGSDVGNIHQYIVNTDSLRNGSFQAVTQSVFGRKLGIRTNISVTNINDDNAPDFFVGNSRGGIHFYSNAVTDPSLIDTVLDTIIISIAPPIRSFEVAVYPNPAQHQIVISSQESPLETIHIRNLLGETVYENSANEATETITVQTTEWSTGVYFVHIYSKGMHVLRKVLVQ